MMSAGAKAWLEKTVAKIRGFLLPGLSQELEKEYLLSLPLAQADLSPDRSLKRRLLESFLEEKLRGEEGLKKKGGASPKTLAAYKDRYLQEAIKLRAATFLNRLIVMRQLEELKFRPQKLVAGGLNSPAYKGLRDFAPAVSNLPAQGFSMLIELIFEDLAEELPGLFEEVGLEELLPISPKLWRDTLDALNYCPELSPDEVGELWEDDTLLGWVYQFFNDPDRLALDAKVNDGGKIENFELASKTQLFTDRYMVEWLLQNALTRTWFAICQKNSWVPEAVSSGTLQTLEAKRQEFRKLRERGQVSLEALMPLDTELERRYRYYVSPPPPPVAPLVAPPVALTMSTTSQQRAAGESIAATSGEQALYGKDAASAIDATTSATSGEQALYGKDAASAIDATTAATSGEQALYGKDAASAIDAITGATSGATSGDKSTAGLASLGSESSALNATFTSPANPTKATSAAGGKRTTDATSGATGGPSTLKELKLLDPACGSGHFLVIAFELLFALYEEEARHRGLSISDEEIAQSIVENNLHGIDIDPRAVQIAAAALWLKSKRMAPNSRFKRMNLVSTDLNLASLPPDDPALTELVEAIEKETGIVKALSLQVIEALKGADHLGSLLKVDSSIEAAILSFESGKKIADVNPDQGDLFQGYAPSKAELAQKRQAQKRYIFEEIKRFLSRHTGAMDLGLRLRGEQLASGVRFVSMVQPNQYDLVVGNPPYQGAGKMADSKYIERNYKEGKADLYAAFLLRGIELAKPGGYSSLLSMKGWMFITTYAAFRKQILSENELEYGVDLDRGAFEKIAAGPGGVAAVITGFRKGNLHQYGHSVIYQPSPRSDTGSLGLYQRKQAALLAGVGRYQFETTKLAAVPDHPLIYWWSPEFLERYAQAPKIGDESPAKQGLSTADNTRFLRLPWEVSFQDIALPQSGQPFPQNISWAPFIKGAAGLAWFEPVTGLIRAQNKLLEFYNFKPGVMRNPADNFRLGIAFSMIGASFSARAHRYRSIFGNMGSSVFTKDVANTLCLMNSKLAKNVMTSLNPGVHFEVGDVNRLPLLPIEGAAKIVAQLEQEFSRHEAARETSVEFQRPGESAWEYAQSWAQEAVDRPAGAPLPAFQAKFKKPSRFDQLSYAVGIALGRFLPFEAIEDKVLKSAVNSDGGGKSYESGGELKNSGSAGVVSCIADPLDPVRQQSALAAGILFIGDAGDSLDQPACKIIWNTWEKYFPQGEGKITDLRQYLRSKFFAEVHNHKDRYRPYPIYFPLSSANKNFVAFISIHRWGSDTLELLILDHLMPRQKNLKQELDELMAKLSLTPAKEKAPLEKRYQELNALLVELERFSALVQEVLERGPQPADLGPKKPCPPREANARFRMFLDDGVMINSAVLWPLLEPQWKEPKTWWFELVTAQGRKDYDWSKQARRYFPTRVEEKCKVDPSLAVAHGLFWKYHPEKAYQWEQRLQSPDELGPEFKLVEDGYAEYKSQFEKKEPDKVRELEELEAKRREKAGL